MLSVQFQKYSYLNQEHQVYRRVTEFGPPMCKLAVLAPCQLCRTQQWVYSGDPVQILLEDGTLQTRHRSDMWPIIPSKTSISFFRILQGKFNSSCLNNMPPRHCFHIADIWNDGVNFLLF